MRFINPIAVRELSEPLAGSCSTQFRAMRPIDAEATHALRELCDQQPDETANYVDEIKRIERFARAEVRLLLPVLGREDGFTWEDASEYYRNGC